MHHTSVVETEAELREAAREMIAKYDQPALVEDYVAGREFTVGLLGERRPKVLPPMEVVFLAAEKHPVYSFEYKQDWSSKIRYDVPANLQPAELKALERAARECFIALGCRDVARVDFRMDEQGKIYFLESNPLPGLTPGWSDLVLIAKAAGIEYNALIAEILSGAIRRTRFQARLDSGSEVLDEAGVLAVAGSVDFPTARMGIRTSRTLPASTWADTLTAFLDKHGKTGCAFARGPNSPAAKRWLLSGRSGTSRE